MSGYDDGRSYDERAYPQQRPYDPRYPSGPPASGPPPRVTVNAGRLWAAGVATALVCALIGLVGVLVVRAVFKVALYAPEEASAVGDIDTGLLCIAAAGAALVATGLVHLLLLSTPRPLSYFGWIVGLATLAAVVVPFLSVSPLSVGARSKAGSGQRAHAFGQRQIHEHQSTRGRRKLRHRSQLEQLEYYCGRRRIHNPC